MQSNFAKRWRGAAVSVLLAASVLPAHAGFFDDLVNKGAELVKGVGKALNTGPSEETVLAQTPEQQDQTLIKLYEAKDYEIVVRLANALHAKNSAVGTYFIGVCTLLGEGVAQNKDKGLDLIKQAAQAGDIRAKSVLGTLFASDKDVRLEPAVGMQYLVAGAEKFDEAAEMLALLYEEGLRGIPKDRAKALAVYKNHKWADPNRWQDKIRKLEAQLQAIPSVNVFLAQSPQQQETTLQSLQTANDYINLLELANALAPSGSPVAQYYLGQAHVFGQGVAEDKAKGMSLLLQSADAGFKRAQMHAGILLTSTKDTSLKNVAKGIPYLEASANEFWESAYGLAQLYEKGDAALAQDKTKALAYYKSINAPSMQGELKPKIAALEYELKPVPTLAELLAMQVEQQREALSDLYNRKKFAELMPLALALDEKGGHWGTYYVGTMHSFGRGVVQNEKLGAEYWKKAADAGIHAAESNAGRGFLFGQWGFARDEVLGVKYLQACFDFFNDCAFELARAHQNGWGGLPKNKDKALAIFKNHKWDANYSQKSEIAKKIKELDPTAGAQEVFVKVMEAAKSIGVRVADVSTQGNSFHGSGSMTINGSIKVGFSCELMIFEGMKPKLFMYFTSDDRRVHDPLRKRMVSALENKFGNLRSAFDGNSTMFVQDW